MPFGSYNNEEQAASNAIRLIKEGGADVIKLEGGKRVAKIAQALTDLGIAVMGHIGLTPQSHVMLGGYGTQGKSVQQAKQIVDDALALQGGLVQGKEPIRITQS
jgi:3-methyl-2-oxobutanoate hydroxymethyltransferase